MKRRIRLCPLYAFVHRHDSEVCVFTWSYQEDEPEPSHTIPISNLPLKTLAISHPLSACMTVQIALGYNMILTLAPKVFGGRLCLNFALTTPEFPCGLVTLPQIALILDPCLSFDAR